MNIEDLITSLVLSSRITLTTWESGIVYSFIDQIGKGTGFTEKQATVAVKLLTKYQHSLSAALKLDIGNFLENPTYKYPFRKLNTAKRMSIKSHAIYNRVIKVEFPFNEQYISHIKNSRNELDDAIWNPEEKSWAFPLTENSIQFLSELMKQEKFDCDEEFQMLVDQSDKILDNIEHHAPTLVLENNRPKLVNISQFMPELSSHDLLAAMFESRRKGIITWSEEIDQWLEDSDLNPFTKEFLRLDPSAISTCDCEKYSIDCISDIVKYMSPCLFVIPGGSELTKLKLSYNFLRGLEIDNQDMSVMFRLATADNKEFNDFVKERGINSPLGENTKIVFVSGKIPKPLLKSNIKFNSIINLGFANTVHYSTRDYLASHENLIYYSEGKNKKDIQFGNL